MINDEGNDDDYEVLNDLLITIGFEILMETHFTLTGKNILTLTRKNPLIVWMITAA